MSTPGAAAARTGSTAPHPGKVTKAVASSWSSTSIGLSWVNPRTPSFRVVVVRAARGRLAPTGPTDGTPVGSTRARTLTATGLTPHTAYSFALFARDAGGHHGQAVVVHAVTAPAPVTRVRTTVTDAAAALAWADPPTSTFRGVVVRYTRGRTAPASPGAGYAARVASPRASGTSIAGLAPDTTYAVSIWTYDARHHYSSAGHTTFRTRRAPGPVSSVQAMIRAVTRSGVTQSISWALPRSPDLTGVLVRRAKGAGAPSPTSGTLIADVSAPATKVVDRAPVGTHTYALFAHDSSGHYAAAAVLVVSTDRYSHTAPAIQGRVTTSSGAAVAGASVTATAVDDDPAAATTARTDSAGYYTLAAGIYTGSQYRICVQSPRAATTSVRTACHAADVVPGAVAATRGVDLVLVAGGHLGGHVTGKGSALAGAAVVLLDPDDDSGTPLATTTTGPDGAYDLSQLAPGRYAVCVDAHGMAAPGYVSACRGGKVWQPGQPSPQGSVEVAVRAGASTVTNLNLPEAGAITGTVSSDSTPVSGVTVTARDPHDQSVLATATTTTDGSYEIGSLAPGTDGYLVCFDASALTAPPRRSECWHGTPWNRHVVPADVQAVQVRAGTDTGGVDADLAAGASISGVVTAASSAGPLAGVSVQVFDAATDDPIADAVTDGTGHYTVGSMAPTTGVIVCADASTAIGPQPGGGYLARCLGPGGSGLVWTPGERPPGNGYAVALPSGAQVTGIDLALPNGNALTGAVRNTSGAGVAGVSVYALSLFPERVLGVAATDANGAYRIPGLEAGSVFVCAQAALTSTGRPTGYANQCVRNLFWNGQLKTTPPGLMSIAVPSTGPVDISLVRFARITGTITTGADRTPVAGATITVLRTSGELAAPTTTSAADGTYAVSRLPAGTYRVCVDGRDATTAHAGFGYARECWGNVAWDRTELPRGPAVTTTAGSSTNSVDVSLSAAGRVTGRVIASGDKAPITDVDVLVYDADGEVTASARSTRTGSYSIVGLDPHFSYTVCFDPVDAVGSGLTRISLRAQCWVRRSWGGADHDLPSGTTQITPVSGKTLSLGDTTLTRAGSVAGTVTSAVSHDGVDDVVVYAFNANGDEVASTQTDAAGHYYLRGFGGAAGGYRICAYAPTATTREQQLMSSCFVDTDWDGGFTVPTGARAISVRASSPRAGIDLELPRQVTISGTVTDIGGAAVPGALAEVFDTAGTRIGDAATDGNGRYEVAVPAGADPVFWLCVDPSYAWTGSYRPRCYLDTPWGGGADAVPPGATALSIPATGGGIDGVDVRLTG